MYSYISVKVKNLGKVASPATRIRLTDFNLTTADTSIWIEPKTDPRKQYPYGFFEQFQDISAIAPGQEIAFVITMKHWAFNPNTYLEIVVDPDNKIPEEKKKNNTRILTVEG
jgi:subtilase family serine protease